MSETYENEVYLSSDEALAYLKTSRPKLLRLVDSGQVRQYKMALSKSVYYKQIELDALKKMEPVKPNEIDELSTKVN